MYKINGACKFYMHASTNCVMIITGQLAKKDKNECY